MMPFRTSLATNVSALSKSGYSHADPSSQNDRLDASGSVTSFRSSSCPGGSLGMNVPSLNRIPSHSPSEGQSIVVAFVSGPRRVRKVLPLWRVTAISKLAAAIDTNGPPRSLRERQTLSINGESDGLSSKFRNTGSIVTNWKATHTERRPDSLPGTRLAPRNRHDQHHHTQRCRHTHQRVHRRTSQTAGAR